MVISSLYIIHTPYAPPASARFSAMGGARKEAAHTHTRYTRLLDVHRITFFFGKNRVVIYFPPHLVVFETPGKTPSTGTSREKKKRRETPPPPSLPPAWFWLLRQGRGNPCIPVCTDNQAHVQPVTTTMYHTMYHNGTMRRKGSRPVSLLPPSLPSLPFPPFPPFLTRQ